MRPLSHSSISTYEQCPLKWKLHYIDKIPEEPKPYFTFGSVMHDVMEYFYVEKENGKIKGPRFSAPPVNELLAYYDSIWSSEGYESPEQEENYRQLGEKIIKEYHEQHARNFTMPIATEHYFIIDIDGVKVRGYIDRVDKLSPDSVRILDYKTTRDPFRIPYVKKDEQLALYQMAFEELHNKRVERLSLYHLRSNMDFSVGRRPERMIRALRKKILRVADAIEKEEFEPKKSNLCPYCDYQHLCPYFMDLYAEKTKEKISVEDMVEEYAQISLEMSRLKKRRDGLSAILREYAEEKGMLTIYGKRSALTVSSYERVDFDDGVRPLLESAGLWTQVSKLDSKRLKELVDGGAISQELMEQIERYRTIKKITTLRRRKMKDEEMDVS